MARRLAPVKTGELRDSIEVETEADGSARVVVGAEHGLIVELGSIHIPPQPFLMPAIYGTKHDRLRRHKEAMKG